MIEAISLLYGGLITILIYGVSFFSVRGMIKNRCAHLCLIIGKYFIYWKVIDYGFKAFLPVWVLIGFTAGIYLSLPVLYFFNKKESLVEQIAD